MIGFSVLNGNVRQNQFNQERHLYSRVIFKFNQAADFADWRQLLSV